jgi:uncharacterized membrane protein
MVKMSHRVVPHGMNIQLQAQQHSAVAVTSQVVICLPERNIVLDGFGMFFVMQVVVLVVMVVACLILIYTFVVCVGGPKDHWHATICTNVV